MKRLLIADLFDLGTKLGELKKLLDKKPMKAGDAFFGMSNSIAQLKNFVDGEHSFSLCRDEARELRDAVDTALKSHFYEQNTAGEYDFKSGVDFEEEFPPWRTYVIKSRLDIFNHVFAAECRNCETYFIPSKKLGMDVATLLREGDTRIHETIRSQVPKDALDELKDAGRCLALESYTASGFHTLRALEIVMDDYLKVASGKDREYRSWYDYIKALDRLAKGRSKTIVHKPSPKVVAMLDRMRQLDRNPLMHPRDSLDEMAADTLFSIGIATITEMAKDLREWAGQHPLHLVGSADEQAKVG